MCKQKTRVYHPSHSIHVRYERRSHASRWNGCTAMAGIAHVMRLKSPYGVRLFVGAWLVYAEVMLIKLHLPREIPVFHLID